jgi:hypothetical protein
MFVGSFSGNFVQFQTDTVNAFAAFEAAGVTQLLIDLTNNGGTCCWLSSAEALILNIWSLFRGIRLPWRIPASIFGRFAIGLSVRAQQYSPPFEVTALMEIIFRGFQTTQRGNALAQKIVANDIELGVTQTFYAPDNCAFSNWMPCGCAWGVTAHTCDRGIL